MSGKQRPGIDPVILVTLGIGFITLAVVLFALQNQSEQSLAIRASPGFSGRLMVAFITGLTTGGLSCLAVQGGLLASSLARQIEQDYLEQSIQPKRRGKKQQPKKRTN